MENLERCTARRRVQRELDCGNEDCQCLCNMFEVEGPKRARQKKVDSLFQGWDDGIYVSADMSR